MSIQILCLTNCWEVFTHFGLWNLLISQTSCRPAAHMHTCCNMLSLGALRRVLDGCELKLEFLIMTEFIWFYPRVLQNKTKLLFVCFYSHPDSLSHIWNQLLILLQPHGFRFCFIWRDFWDLTFRLVFLVCAPCLSEYSFKKKKKCPDLTYIHGISLSHKKEHIWVSSKEVGELEPVIQWSKSEKEKQIPYTHAYTWDLERWHWWTCLQGSSGDAGIKNRLMDKGGGGRRGWDEWRGWRGSMYTTVCKIESQWKSGSHWGSVTT